MNNVKIKIVDKIDKNQEELKNQHKSTSDKENNDKN